MSRKVTVGGNEASLHGNALEVGQDAPDFVVQAEDMGDRTLNSFEGKTQIFCAIPSVDTGVCDTELRRFNESAAGLDNTVVQAISMDLPFGQKKWCGAAGVENVVMSSDHRTRSFAKAYGCLIEGGPFDSLCSRAVFVVGPDKKLKHVEYVPEVGDEPNYDAALAAAKA